MNLKINVNDEVKVIDTLVDAIKFVEEIIRNYYESPETKPLRITISKQGDDRAPPALGINISENVEMEDRLA